MPLLPRLRALFCLALAWLCAGAITPALAQVPPTPTILSVYDDATPFTGVVGSGSSINDTRPTLSGIGEIGNTINVYDNAVLIGIASVSGSGQWTFSPILPLLDGTHTFTSIASNNNGMSLPSAPYAITVDTTPPQPPVLTNIVVGGATTITGTAEANSIVTIYNNGIAILTVIVYAGSTWSAIPLHPLLASINQITAVATDMAGNDSLPSAERTITPLSSGALTLPNSAGPAQVSIISDTNGCTLGTQPAFGQANLAGAPANAKAPLGALNFTVTGCLGATLTVGIAYPAGSLATLTPYKFGPPSTGAASTWFAHGSVSGDTVTYTVTDNGIGDSNLTPGVIADPFA
uniref:choice-of-anchor U domain-containing protein n=1 Tax=Comamonas sp. TaxID=34028 RepID=UPI00258EEAD6